MQYMSMSSMDVIFIYDIVYNTIELYKGCLNEGNLKKVVIL